MIEIRQFRNPDTGKSGLAYRTLAVSVRADGTLTFGKRPSWNQWRWIERQNITTKRFRRLQESGDFPDSPLWDWRLGPHTGKTWAKGNSIEYVDERRAPFTGKTWAKGSEITVQ